MAISNCLFSPTLEIPAELPTWCVLAKLSAKPTQLLIAARDDVEFGLRRTKLLRVPTVTLSPFCKSTSSEGLHQIANSTGILGISTKNGA